MAALRKILGIHITYKMRNKNIRMALNLTDTIAQKVRERQHKWHGHIGRMDKNKVAKLLYCTADRRNTEKRTQTNNMAITLARHEVGPQVPMEIAQDRNRWRLISTISRAYADVQRALKYGGKRRRIHDSNEIPTDILMFLASSIITGLIRILFDVRVCCSIYPLRVIGRFLIYHSPWHRTVFASSAVMLLKLKNIRYSS